MNRGWRNEVKRAIIAPKSHFTMSLWVAGGIGTAAVVRLLIDHGTNGVPFVTFFPIILLTAVFLDWRYSLVAAAGSAVVASQLFMPDEWASSLTWSRQIIFAMYVLTVTIIVTTAELLRHFILESERRAEEAEIFNVELQHRAKNALQIMRTLIVRAGRASDPRESYQSLIGRLDALTKANELLRFGTLPDCAMDQLVESAIAPFEPPRFALCGPACQVAKEGAMPLMLALHELCTNASKYGALSRDTGSVEISWRPAAGPGENEIEIDWVEQNGPAVTKPIRTGIGTRILAANAGLHEVHVQFNPEGLTCRMRVQAAVTGAHIADQRTFGDRIMRRTHR